MRYPPTVHLAVTARSLRLRLRDEAGEGVISTAIAVLILAFVGAAMWVGFNAMMSSTCDAAAIQLDQSIGSGGGSSIACQGPVRLGRRRPGAGRPMPPS